MNYGSFFFVKKVFKFYIKEINNFPRRLVIIKETQKENMSFLKQEETLWIF